jgi:putative peptidoglycan lipid II flippase
MDLRNPDVRQILANSALLTGSGLIARLRAPIMQYFGSQLGEGAIAAISITLKLCRPIYDTLLMGVQMIVFSRSSREVAKGNLDKLADIYNYALSAVLIAVMPIAIWIALNARPLIDVVFLRGEFTEAMAALTSLALLGAVGMIVFQGTVKLLSHSFYAMHRIMVPLVAMPLGTVVYFFASKYFSEAFGVFGLTLANSLIATLMTSVMAIILGRLLAKFSAFQLLRRALAYFGLAAIGGYAGLQLALLAGLDSLPRLVLSFAVLSGVYVGVLWLARETIFARVLKSIRNAATRGSK